MKDLNNKVVWLTGASSGIGEAMAYAFVAEGAKLILSSRRESELERVKNNCPAESQDNIKILTIDLADAGSLEEKCKTAESLFGQIDVLVNNGGISQRDRVINTKIEVDRELMEINYFGSIALTKNVLPGMVERQQGHHVVITSATGIISTPLRSSYAASKHALHGFYDSLRSEHHDDNIKVTIVCPGYVKTNISINARMGSGEKQNSMDDAQANGLSPEFVAKKIIRSIKKDKLEVYIGGLKEVAGIYLKRFVPTLFAKVVRKTNVT